MDSKPPDDEGRLSPLKAVGLIVGGIASLIGVYLIMALLFALGVFVLQTVRGEDVVWGEGTTTSTSSTLPRAERLAWPEFLHVLDDRSGLRDECERIYSGDLDACYYGYIEPRGLEEEWYLEVYALATRPTPEPAPYFEPGPPRNRPYQSNQYGCHDDGRCLDDYDHWCDEDDLVYFESTDETICPDSWDLAQDSYIDRQLDLHMDGFEPDPVYFDD